MRLLPCLVLACLAASAHAQAVRDLPGVTITARRGEPQVEKSYRRMLRGVDLFEQRRAAQAPQATLRFRLLPRQAGVQIDRDLALYIVGRSVEIPLEVAPDRTFALPRDARAAQENAQVTPDRRARSLTWRAEVRTPGLPPGTRRLGDLRLECAVGMEAGLVSDNPSPITQFFNSLADGPSYCERPGNRYLFFADAPLWGATLVHGDRREPLPTSRLWAGALGDPRPQELAVCDCELLVDRAWFAPLHDRRWPDDTLVVLEPLEGAGAPR